MEALGAMAWAHSMSNDISSLHPQSPPGFPLAKTVSKHGLVPPEQAGSTGRPNCCEKTVRSLDACGESKAWIMAMTPLPPLGLTVVPLIGQPGTCGWTILYTHPREAGVSPVGELES